MDWRVETHPAEAGDAMTKLEDLKNRLLEDPDFRALLKQVWVG
jgi:hypothetical protein